MAVHEMAKALGDAHAVYEACPPLERHAEVVQPLHGAADSTNSLARMAYRASQGRRGGRKDRRCRRKSVCGSSTHLAQAASEGSANSTYQRNESPHALPQASPNVLRKSSMTKAGVSKILDKGRGAYFSSGSRPNQTPESWARARLASVLMGGPARKVDQNIWNQHKK